MAEETYSKCEVVGRLVRDTQVKLDGKLVTGTLVTERTFTKKDGTEGKRTAYIDIVAWRQMADFIGQRSKGDVLGVCGELITESWDDKETGKKRYKLVLEVSDVFQTGEPPAPPKPAPAKVETKRRPAPPVDDGPHVPVDEKDIPF